MRRGCASFVLLLLAVWSASPSALGEPLKDPYFGEALYYAYQGRYFDALERLDCEVDQHDDLDEPRLDSLWYHIDAAEFSLGDFELRYRMHQRAGRAIRAVLEGAVDDLVRNDAAFRLARIHFQKGQLEDALQALDRIHGSVPTNIEDAIEFLRGNVDLARGDAQRAVPIFTRLQDSNEFGAFAAYNLGIALRSEGEAEEAQKQLERAGRMAADDPAALALRDKANLVLGTLLLEGGQFAPARLYLGRVRLDGPYSNQALLSAGWANLSAGDFDRAVVPWSILAQREVTDAAVQEAMVALPYAYGKLELYARAAVAYGHALDSFGTEVARLDESIESIHGGHFLEALIREEVHKDKDWVIRLRSLPETPETFYLMDLLASHDFQTGLQNYLDLADLKRRLKAWNVSLNADDDLIVIRRDHFDPLLPAVDDAFRVLDSRLKLRIEQHKTLVRRRDELLTMPRPELLATREEQMLLKRLEALESAPGLASAPSDSGIAERIARLKGRLLWDIETEYPERLDRFDTNLRSLGDELEVARENYDRYVRARQAATHSYEGYSTQIGRLRTRTAEAQGRVELSMARQGSLLEQVAIEVLRNRRERLEKYRDKVRYALADSYDRATQAQANVKVPGADGRDGS